MSFHEKAHPVEAYVAAVVGYPVVAGFGSQLGSGS
jgi:hypothetical protein